MNNVDVCLTYPLPQAQILLESAGLTTYTWAHERRPNSDELIELAQNSHALLSMLTDKIDETLLKRAPQLKVIANNAVGFNNIDLAACEKYQVSVCNTPGVLTDATADLAMGLLICTARRMSEASLDMRAGGWRGWNPKSFVGVSLKNKALGIIGMGRIGQALAQRAHAGFGMKILYSGTSAKELGIKAQFVSQSELLKESDFVSIHCPLNEKTKGLIGARELKLMKREAILINTARGEIIDEEALVQALKEDLIMGAGLDVFASEPLSLESELFKLSNVTLTPHIGSADQETRLAMELLSAQNIIETLAGKRPSGAVLFFAPAP